MSREGALWIGGLEPYMDEEFLKNSLSLMGENSVTSIKVIRNKFTGMTASYGFINFDDDASALMAMHKLNGKIIPNSTPPIRFKLNHNSTRLMPGEKDSSIWVGDLTPDVDDLTLFKFFSCRFQSIKSAKVVMDQSGFSKGYGFIRFGNEEEQQAALNSMMGVCGLGSKPIRVSLAITKAKQQALAVQPVSATSHIAASIAASFNAANPQAATGDYSSQQYWDNYNQYWSQYAAWSQYSQQYYDQSAATPSSSSYYATEKESEAPVVEMKVPVVEPASASSSSSSSKKESSRSKTRDGSSSDLVNHSEKYNYDKLNSNYLSTSNELWESLHKSLWWTEE